MNKKDSQRLSNRKQEPTYPAQNSKGLLFTSCAFHPTEKITNFCTSKQCLLPLCPKCVKIHTDQHVKMGIFGEFNTIQESFHQADDGLKSTVLRLGDFQRIIIDVRREYDQKIAQQRKSIRDAKNQFIEEIERICDEYEKAMLAFEAKENKQFLDELYTSQDLLGHLSEHCEKAIRRLSSTQTVMEGIINYYSEVDQLHKIDVLAQNLQKQFPQTLAITYYTSDLERLQSMIKRYIDAGRANQEIWNLHKALFHKQVGPKQFQRSGKDQRKQPVLAPSPKKQESPIRRQQQVVKQKNLTNKMTELNTLESNLNLARFKSPLDNFSLSKLRNQYKDFK